MSQLWIKICGITRNSDARAAFECGADAIGLVFYPRSPRAVTTNQVSHITAGLQGVQKVTALFVDPSEDEVNAVVETGCIDILQFHGSEPAEFCNCFGLPYLKALNVRDSITTRRDIKRYTTAEYILLDSFVKQVPGGTGKTFDWNIAKEIVGSGGGKFIVAGGLNSENVQSAVSLIKPFGIDVSSGVEIGYGIKDLKKISAFISGARSV